ncbi:MAG TPA: hypothetical protein VE967_00635 [Gemmatimonadaceae bacterium]|nr:hypothetical protein [Gemmatimonadaceae bacterium]
MTRVLAVLLLVCRTAFAQTSTWVEVMHREPMAAGRTQEDVKGAALNAALAEAVRRVAGVRVSGSELAVRAESAGRVLDRYNEVISVAAQGRVTDWRIARERWLAPASAGTPVAYELTIRVQVTAETGAADPAFHVQLEVSAQSLSVRSNDVTLNDELVARVTPTRDAFITLALVAGDSVFVLAPNALMRASRMAAATAELPPPDLRASGLHFRASLPPDVDERVEQLVVVATLDAPPALSAGGDPERRDTTVPSLTEFNRWLVGIPVNRRALATLPLALKRIK